jgi:hypothetical protein
MSDPRFGWDYPPGVSERDLPSDYWPDELKERVSDLLDDEPEEEYDNMKEADDAYDRDRSDD